MRIDPLFQSGMQGIERGMQNMRRSAHEIVRAGTVARDKTVTDVAGDLVALKMNRTAVQAAVSVVKAADEVLGSLLDIQA